MFPKPKRTKDSELLKQYRKGHCELCGNPYRLEVHHIKSRGSGGDDVEENLITLCAFCHYKVHSGLIKKEELQRIKGGR